MELSENNFQLVWREEAQCEFSRTFNMKYSLVPKTFTVCLLNEDIVY